MNEKNSDEIRYRRLAFKLFDKGNSTAQILIHIPRSRAWLFKWKQRFAQQRWQALASLSQAPQPSPQQYDQRVVKVVLRLRNHLQRAEVGLRGARALRPELRAHRLVRPLPALSPINRWLKAAGLSASGDGETTPPYSPAPRLRRDWAFDACEWIARDLEGGAKVFVFHPIDAHTHALCQTSRTDKTTLSVCHHLLHACAVVGVPDFLHLDNDAAFTGLGNRARGFGQFVRLALYLGIELIFIPPGEPQRNSLVEGVKHLWAQSFWEKNHFASVKAYERKSPKFLSWYEAYAPPALQGLTVKEARRGGKRRKLTTREITALPAEVPLTQGRLHLLRQVTAQGEINLLKENWKVSKRLAGQYVWATIDLSKQNLEIYHRRSERAQARMVKSHAYPIEERVERVKPGYRRGRRKVRVLEII